MDHDILPPPPLTTQRNTAGGLLNRFDASANLQVKILCVGMFNTGKSTFLNRWQTNLKTKTRTTINIDFYEKHTDGFFPIMLQDRPDPVVVEAEDSRPSAWATVDFPSSVNNGKGPAVSSNLLVTQSNFYGNAPSDSEYETGSPTSAAVPLAGSYTKPSTLGVSPSANRRSGGLLGGGNNSNNSGNYNAINSNTNSATNNATTFPPATGAAPIAPSSSTPSGVAEEKSLALRTYRNPRYTDSTPNVMRALMKAAEVAKKARVGAGGSASEESATAAADHFEIIQRGTQRKPISEADGAQVLSVYSLTRELGTVSGSGRVLFEVFGLTQPLNAIRRNVRDPRQVASCAMNTNFGYSYYEKRPLHVQCWDIQGQEHSRSMTRTYYADAFAALVFVDITRPESLADAVLWRKDIAQKVFIKTATDASMDGGGSAGGKNAAAGGLAPSRHGRGAPRTGAATTTKTTNAKVTAAATTANSAAPSNNSGGAAGYETEEETQILCWLVLNKCDLLESRTGQLPNRGAWQAQTADYKDFDDFCVRHNFAGWSMTSATQNINVTGVMDRVVQLCCNQFPREIYRYSTRGKQSMLQTPKPRPKQQKKCCVGTIGNSK